MTDRVIHVMELDPDQVAAEQAKVEVDPALVLPERPPSTTPRVYFAVDDGDISYTIVARDRAHAEELLRKAGVEFYDEDTGRGVQFDQATWLEWREITPERAAQIKVYDDEDKRHAGPYPLNTYEPGDWFCSEF